MQKNEQKRLEQERKEKREVAEKLAKFRKDSFEQEYQFRRIALEYMSAVRLSR